MIALSCHSRNYGPGTPEEQFSFIRKLGFAYIDVDGVGTIPQAEVQERPQTMAAYTKRLADRNGLRLAEYFMGNVLVDGRPYNPSEPDGPMREAMLASFAAVCRYAGEAGFRSMMGSAGSVIEAIGPERSFENAARVLARMVGIAAEHGVALHVEPSRQSLLRLPERALEMVQAVEGLRYTMDFLHFHVNGIDQEESMKLLPHTGHMHARQAAVGWPKCPYEHGEIDFDRIMKRLRGLKWDGVIAMEFWNGPDESAAGICPVEQTILMRAELKRLIKRYYG